MRQRHRGAAGRRRGKRGRRALPLPHVPGAPRQPQPGAGPGPGAEPQPEGAARAMAEQGAPAAAVPNGGSAARPLGNKVTVVLGAQWGDEGKGKVVDLLAQDADIVCRCQVRRGPGKGRGGGGRGPAVPRGPFVSPRRRGRQEQRARGAAAARPLSAFTEPSRSPRRSSEVAGPGGGCLSPGSPGSSGHVPGVPLPLAARPRAACSTGLGRVSLCERRPEQPRTLPLSLPAGTAPRGHSTARSAAGRART